MDLPKPASNVGAGSILRLIRDGEAVTRGDLARTTGLGRSSVAQRLEALISHRLVIEGTYGESTGGRPPGVLRFNQEAGVVLAGDLGARHARLAVTNLAGASITECETPIDIADGPEAVLSLVHEHFQTLLREAGRTRADIRGIAIGVPGPVQFSTGQPVSPPIMPGWDGFSIPSWFAKRYDVPALVDNDVNIMALGEHHAGGRAFDHLLFVKVATGIGCGIISEGRVHRGAQGAAGDIGHVRVTGHDDIVCDCGNVGCLEAVASGRAMARRLAAEGREANNSHDVVRLVRAGDPLAILLVREAGQMIGEVLATCVNIFNPSAIVIGGEISEVRELLLARVREVTFQRSLPLATRDLRTMTSQLGERAGVLGAAMLVIEHVLAPEMVDRAISSSVAA